MSKFNTSAPKPYQTPNVANYEGGAAFGMVRQNEIVTILLTSFVKDKFYEKADATLDRLRVLIAQLEPSELLFVAKAIVYARTVFGMRSITHVAAAEMAKKISGLNWASNFFKSVIYRPDDMTEIMSYIHSKEPKDKKGHRRIPNIAALRKGFAEAINKFTGYSLAKYRGEGKGFKLVDVVNYAHPKPTENNAFAIQQLLKGELKSTETWESMLSAAGSDTTKKQLVWSTLIGEKKIGYLALLRNLRNIIEQAPSVLPAAIASLTDGTFIGKSLILPFQYATAYNEIEKINYNNAQARIALAGISKAVDVALMNVPRFEGETLIVLDVSGSMTGAKCGNQSVAEVGAMFAAVMVKANNADFISFSDNATYKNLNLMDTTLTVAKSIPFSSGGTELWKVPGVLNKKYDRIIILSDMQAYNYTSYGYRSNATSFAQQLQVYKTKYKANPRVYSFDLAGYGTLQMHEDRTYLLAGFSNETMKLMQYLEKDKDALRTEINKIEL